MNSIDVGHVPPPDPANYWRFHPGQTTMVCELPYVSLRLNSVDEHPQIGTRVYVTMEFRNRENRTRPTIVSDWLELDRPCVALRLTNNEPAITFTLREVVAGYAFLQVTAHPSISEKPRTV